MDPTTPQSSSRFWILAVVATLVTVAVVVGVVASGGDERDEPPATTASDTTDDEPEDPAEPQEQDLDAEIAELSAETERIRGLPFLEPVDVTFLTDEEFEDRILADLEEDLDSGELDEVALVWRALELIPPDTDLGALLRQALAGEVLGFYDPETDELVMRGVVLDPFVRSTLVHELTHALDDQHFDLDRAELMDGDDSEAQFGFIGLVEGTATWVEEQWVTMLDRDEVAELRRREAEFGVGIDLRGIPDILLIDISLPYILGPTFVRELVAAAGTDGIDAAYLDLPTSGEHILEPESYEARDLPVVVVNPPADGTVISEGVIGASGLFEMLLDLDVAAAQRMARAWEGDRYVVWRNGDEVCLRADVLAEPDATTTMRDGLETFVEAHSSASVEPVGDLLRFTACA